MDAAMRLEIRPYCASDAQETLNVFLRAVSETAGNDYSAAQIDAWAGAGGRTLVAWNTSRESTGTLVAVAGAAASGLVIGFVDVSPTGYIDMLFVDPDYSRQGVASELLHGATTRALSSGAHDLSTNASITAVPFFERHGFTVIAERHPVIGEISLTNYRMTKGLLQA